MNVNTDPLIKQNLFPRLACQYHFQHPSIRIQELAAGCKYDCVIEYYTLSCTYTCIDLIKFQQMNVNRDSLIF